MEQVIVGEGDGRGVRDAVPAVAAVPTSGLEPVWVWKDEIVFAKTATAIVKIGTYQQLLAIATEIAVSRDRKWVLYCKKCLEVCTFVEPCTCTAQRMRDRHVTIGDHAQLMTASEFYRRVDGLQRDRTRGSRSSGTRNLRTGNAAC